LLTVGVEFERRLLQLLWSPACNLSSLEAQLEQKRREARGGAGIYTGADTLRRGLGFSTGARRWTAEGDPVQEEESLPEVGDDMWGWALERERRAGLVPVQLGRLAGPGLKWSLGRMVSPGLFCSFFFYLLIFWFYSNLFANFIQINSNKILKYSIVHCSVLKQ
jgi:hypothetical protein